MPYLTLRAVESYHEVSGDGPAVVLLHGGGCSLEVFGPLARELPGYRIHAAERPGHGRTPDRPGPYSYADVVADTLAYLDALGLQDAHLVGFSDGAIAALLIARDHPDRARSVVAIGANLSPDGLAAESSDASMPAELITRIDEQNAALAPGGAAQVAQVEAKLHALWAAEPQIPAESLRTIAAPTLVMAGQHDLMTLDHTALIAGAIPGAQLCIVPGAGHLLILERPSLAGHAVREFLDNP